MDFLTGLLPESVKNVPTHMDFDGQKNAERYFQAIIVLFAAIGFVWGYITQYFSHCIYILFVGVALSSLLTLVPWPMYRQKPLSWQPAREEDEAPAQASPPAAAPAKPKKKKLKD